MAAMMGLKGPLQSEGKQHGDMLATPSALASRQGNRNTLGAMGREKLG